MRLGESYLNAGIIRRPGNERNLVAISQSYMLAQTHTRARARVMSYRGLDPNVPNAVAGGEVVFEIIDSISASLANSALVAHQHSTSKKGNKENQSTRDEFSFCRVCTNRFALGGRVDQLLPEVLPVAIGGGILNDNLLEVVGEFEDDELVLLGELQVIIGCDAVLRNGCSGKREGSRGGGSAVSVDHRSKSRGGVKRSIAILNKECSRMFKALN